MIIQVKATSKYSQPSKQSLNNKISTSYLWSSLTSTFSFLKKQPQLNIVNQECIFQIAIQKTSNKARTSITVFMDSWLQTTSTKAERFLKYGIARNWGKRPGAGWKAGDGLKNLKKREQNKIRKKLKHALCIELGSNSLKHQIWLSKIWVIKKNFVYNCDIGVDTVCAFSSFMAKIGEEKSIKCDA